VIARQSAEPKALIMATLEQVTFDDELDREIQSMSTDDVVNRTKLLENDIKV
jgi:hypothetical protein